MSRPVYAEDVVEVTIHGLTSCAIVTRCWADETNPQDEAEALRLGIPWSPLAPGQLEILHPGGARTEIPEIECTIVDRSFLIGDIVRAAGGAGQAGIITHLTTSVQLSRVLAGVELEGWIDTEEIVAAARLCRADHVVFGDWVGIVVEVFEMAMFETGVGEPPKRVCDTGNAFTVGALAAAESAHLDTHFPDHGFEGKRVLEVRQVVIAVNWLCMSQLLDPNEQNVQARPKRCWAEPEFGQLALVRAIADHLHTVGDKVVFRDPNSHPLPVSILVQPHHAGHHVCVVTRSRSTATVLWQDGTSTTALSLSFDHCVNVDDDVDVFPGDVGIFSANSRVGVVQSMNSKKRTVQLRWYGTEEVEMVSGLEFDPHGPPPEVFGVRRQDFVMITKDKNGVELPTVPRLGESEILIGTFPSPELLRHEISQIGLNLAPHLAGPPTLPLSGLSTAHINWYGRVTSLLLDGQVEVRFPDGTKHPFPLDRLYHLDDGLDPDGMGEMMEEGEDGYYTSDDDGSDGGMLYGGAANEEDQEESGMPGALKWEDIGDAEMKRGWADDEIPPNVSALEVSGTKEVVSMPTEVEDHEHWKRFEMLEEAPADHHYLKEAIQVPPKAFMSRVKKEYNVLSSTLPPNILVRAYESRSDLLRCLIIGPLGTPFQNAPFLFDIFLHPTKFPQEPPSVFFHSWAGNTRISPNLYAEGKVCLSLLNTWHGDKNESWSSTGSSILQVLVSLQSLLMTSEPYYLEPGFEKQATSSEGQTSSSLYSERTYVLTRTFVQRALAYPPLNFEEEIKAYYHTGLPTTGPGVLRAVIEQGKLAIEESERWYAEEAKLLVEVKEVDEGMEEEGVLQREESSVVVGLRVLTEGACLSLRRTLDALRKLELARSAAPVAFSV